MTPFSVAMTLPNEFFAANVGMDFEITSAGDTASGHNNQTAGMLVSLLPGYTGNVQTAPARFVNNVASAVGGWNGSIHTLNAGIDTESKGMGVGTNAGMQSDARYNSEINIGGICRAHISTFQDGTPNSAANLGLIILGYNATPGAQSLGAFIGLYPNQVLNTYGIEDVSAAVIVDNGPVDAPVAMFRVNGVTKVQIDALGNLQVLVNGAWKNVAVQP